MLKKLLSCSVDYWHLLLRLVVFGVLTYFILYFITPIVFWLTFGEGANATKVASLTITTIIWTISATLLLYPMIFQRLMNHYNNGRFSKAKDYLIIAVFVLLLSVLITYIQTG
jgi:hypothetical protein